MEYCPHLEIQIAEHCNLNCASCTHFSPLAEASFIDGDSFEDQLKKANAVFRDHAKSLKIMGGEPLLHPELETLLPMARKAMPGMRITLQTNGTLLTGMPEAFWRACSEFDILIRVTRYPVSLQTDVIDALAKRYAVNLKYHPENGVVKSFNRYPLNPSGNASPEANHSRCRMKGRYVLIKEGRLYPCPISGNIEHFNRAFGQPLAREETDSLPLDSINRFEDWASFASKCTPFCRYCQPDRFERDIGWHVSRHAIGEWI